MADTDLFRYQAGRGPLLINVPHAGMHLPTEIAADMTAPALALADTDRYVDQLYAPVAEQIGASLLTATHSRYVADLNRPPAGPSLYPGRLVSPIVPTETFAGEPIYRGGAEPSSSVVADRIARYWQPYHDRLAAELERLKAAHGFALLWDAHSIFSVMPRLFDGRLPDLNLGTNSGESCGAGIGDALLRVARGFTAVDSVLDGRFTGGYITRHYGRPSARVHAVQLEMTMATYMDETPPYALKVDLSATRLMLAALLGAFLATAGA